MAAPIIYGPQFSTYVRTVRLTLEEKPATYELIDVPMMQGAHKEPAFLSRNPFGKVPAFSHDGLDLYETDAIIRYIDQAIPGQTLTPVEAAPRARMNQIIGIVDSFAYPSMITKIVMQRVVAPLMGGTADDAVIQEGLPTAALCVKEIERLLGGNKFLAGDKISLADLMLAPVLHYFAATPEGQKVLQPHGRLRAWWDHMKARHSLISTEPKLG